MSSRKISVNSKSSSELYARMLPLDILPATLVLIQHEMRGSGLFLFLTAELVDKASRKRRSRDHA